MKYVTYEDFRPYHDGVRDDFNAVRNAHLFAKYNRCEVRAVVGEGASAASSKTYHIFRRYDLDYFDGFTSVDWQGATIVIHDEDIDAYGARFTPFLSLSVSPWDASSARNDIKTLNVTIGGSPIGKSTSSIQGINTQLDAALAELKAKGYKRLYVQVYDDNTSQYKRFGNYGGYSSPMWDGFIVDADGKLERTSPTPIQWDFSGITKLVIIPIPEKTSHIRNGRFISTPTAWTRQAAGWPRLRPREGHRAFEHLLALP